MLRWISSGQIYVVDKENNEVQEFASTGITRQVETSTANSLGTVPVAGEIQKRIDGIDRELLVTVK